MEKSKWDLTDAEVALWLTEGKKFEAVKTYRFRVGGVDLITAVKKFEAATGVKLKPSEEES